MKFLSIIFSIIFLGSCTSSMTLKPSEAGIHTLYFEYWQNNEFHPALGQASSIMDGDTKRKIRVLVPKNAHGALLVTDDGNELMNYSVDDKEWVEIDLDDMPANTKTNTVGLSMATENYDVMTGRLYLIGNLNVRDPLSVDYVCPYKDDNGAVGSCTRPTEYNFFLTVKITDDFPGAMRVAAKGKCQLEQDLYELKGKTEIFVKVTNSEKGYCNLRFDTRQDKQNEDWKIKKFKEC